MPTLFDTVPLVAPTSPQGRFDRFVRENPEVMAQIEALALRKFRAGATRLSAKQIFEEIRATAPVHKPDDARWRLNNNWTSFVARWLIARNVELDGYFELRKARVDA